MERRRKALGLRKPNKDKDIYNKDDTPKKGKSIAGIVSRREEEKPVKDEKESTILRTDWAIPDPKTPKRQVNINQSPGVDSSFPRVLGSPEIEVSWDWGCSQVPKDMMPLRRVKRMSQPQQPVPVLSPLVQEPRVFQTRQMSEEENQERLAFYKNVMSLASKCKDEENLESSNSDKNDNVINSDFLSPKCQPKTPIKPINSYFDDSANELMLECSQMIEEQLKNGQISVGAVVSIKMPNQKHALSPDLESENNHKRICNVKSKLNLFPENPKNENIDKNADRIKKQPFNLRSPNNKLLKNKSSCTVKSYPNENGKLGVEDKSLSKDYQDLTDGQKGLTTPDDLIKLRLSKESKTEILSRPDLNSNSRVLPLERRLPNLKQQIIENNFTNNNNKTCRQFQANVNNTKYDSVDKFRKSPKNLCNSNQSVYGVNKSSSSVSNNPSNKGDPVIRNNMSNVSVTTQGNSTSNIKETKQRIDDFTSMLDDGFDMELSSIDFDSICGNSEEPVVPKVCTQAEIEAKRRAALTRLKMKMRR